MIKEGSTYEVYDGSGRHWGHVCFKWLQDETVSGYLETKPDFEKVKKVFIRYDQEITSSDTKEETHNKIYQEIINLNVVLESRETGEKSKVGPVFISPKLLFTCDIGR